MIKCTIEARSACPDAGSLSANPPSAPPSAVIGRDLGERRHTESQGPWPLARDRGLTHARRMSACGGSPAHEGQRASPFVRGSHHIPCALKGSHASIIRDVHQEFGNDTA